MFNNVMESSGRGEQIMESWGLFLWVVAAKSRSANVRWREGCREIWRLHEEYSAVA